MTRVSRMTPPISVPPLDSWFSMPRVVVESRAGLDQVRVTLANPLAVEKCLRFVHSDLNAAFDREKMSGSAEKRRDAEAVDNEAGI